MYQYLFNLPQISGRVGSGEVDRNIKNYIKIRKGDGSKQNPNASIILENYEEPIVIKLEPQIFGKGRNDKGSKAQKLNL